MYQDDIVLCGSSCYTKKYYLNEDFSALPENVKQDLKVMCVLYTEEIGGVLKLTFNEEGDLVFETSANENDLLYDEIGSVLKIKQLRQSKKELLESLEMFFKVFFLGEEIDEDFEN